MLLRVADAHSVREAEVQGLHAAETYLAGVAHRLAAEEVSASPLVRCGDAAEEILDGIWDRHPDLVAMTSHGRTGLTHLLLGSIAEEVLRTSPVPVLLFPTRALRAINAMRADLATIL